MRIKIFEGGDASDVITQYEQWLANNPRIVAKHVQHSTPQVGGGGFESGLTWFGNPYGDGSSHTTYAHVLTVYYEGEMGWSAGNGRIAFFIPGIEPSDPFGL